jgi:hypothetical protein
VRDRIGELLITVGLTPSLGRRYARAYLSLAPSGPRSDFIRLADVLLDPDRAATLDVARLVDTLPANQLCVASRLLGHVTDSAETIVRIARELSKRPPETDRGTAPSARSSRPCRAPVPRPSARSRSDDDNARALAALDRSLQHGAPDAAGRQRAR